MNFPLSLLFAAFDTHNEGDLINRLRRRDAQAMADLHDRYGRLVYSIIFRIVKETGTAEDLTQETFLRVWNRCQFFDREKGALGPWILTAARNRAIDYLRSVDGRTTQKTTEFDGGIEHPESFVNMERDVIHSDRGRILKEAFTAEKMKQPLGSVKTWVRTALKTLRNELEEVFQA